MNARERIQEVFEKLTEGIISFRDAKRETEQAITAAEEAKARAEREAIARLIEQAGLISLRDLAKCVRARSKSEQQQRGD